MFIPSTFKRPVSSWKALNLRKTLLMASSVRLKPLIMLDRKSGSAGMPRPISYAVFCLKKKIRARNDSPGAQRKSRHPRIVRIEFIDESITQAERGIHQAIVRGVPAEGICVRRRVAHRGIGGEVAEDSVLHRDVATVLPKAVASGRLGDFLIAT